MQSAQAIVVAVALGALLAAWGVAHFNESEAPEEIRFSIPQQRYFFALAAHVSVLFAIYALLVLALYGMILLATGEVPHFSCYQVPIPPECAALFKSLEVLKPDVLVWSAVLAALFIRIAVPNVPVLRHPFDRLRELTHGLALFPFARQRLISAFATSGFSGRQDADSELGEELARYGVTAKWQSYLSRSAKQSLLEMHSLRRRLIALSDCSQAFGAAFWQTASSARNTAAATDSETAEATKFASSWMLRRFGRARAAAFADLETGFRRVIRRTALALLLVEEISEKVEDEALCRSVSNFVAEECDDVRVRYRRMVAEAALSCVPHREERAQFLKYFGYQVPTPPALPLRPWVVVFALDFVLFLVPSVVIIFSSGNQAFAPTPLVLFPLVHAISQSVAITWAIYPKVVSNFARPSLYFGRPPLYSLPWQSYIAFGLGSYATGAMILLLFRLLIPMPYPVILPTLLSSLSFLFMTVGMSTLIDLRLQSRSFDFQQGRARDGIAMALLMLLYTLTFQVIMFHVGPLLGWVDPSALVPPGMKRETLDLIRPMFLVLAPALGFVMGYFVPSAAAAFLQRVNLLQLPGPLDRKHGPFEQREKTWDPRLSTQA